MNRRIDAHQTQGEALELNVNGKTLQVNSPAVTRLADVLLQIPVAASTRSDAEEETENHALHDGSLVDTSHSGNQRTNREA